MLNVSRLSSKPTLTTQTTLHPQKGHHQIPTVGLPANTQNNFIIMFNTQYVKYHI